MEIVSSLKLFWKLVLVQVLVDPQFDVTRGFRKTVTRKVSPRYFFTRFTKNFLPESYPLGNCTHNELAPRNLPLQGKLLNEKIHLRKTPSRNISVSMKCTNRVNVFELINDVRPDLVLLKSYKLALETISPLKTFA